MNEPYFTYTKVKELVTKKNWEMVRAAEGKYLLVQKDKSYMRTITFDATPETVRDFLKKD